MNNMGKGIIVKALSGFYYVDDGDEVITCKARGKFRHEGLSPLVGDRVEFTRVDGSSGMLDVICPRKNQFHRPAVANIDQLVLFASETNPVTDPYLLDRIICLAEQRGCEPIICINKYDLNADDRLFELYSASGFTTIRLSAKSGEGLVELRHAIAEKVNAFTGNSGVGKSSILNALEPSLSLPVGEVSEKLGRGRHTTRHVELYRLPDGALVADTPGFSSFDTDRAEQCRKEDLENTFREFAPYLGQCRFTGCAHVKEQGCAVLQALRDGAIQPTRHESYVRLYEQAKQLKDWEVK